MDIHWQAPNNGGTVGVLTYHIQSMYTGGDVVCRRGEETVPVVVEDSSGCPLESHNKRYFGRRMGAEAAGIQKVWWEGRPGGTGQQISDGRIWGSGI